MPNIPTPQYTSCPICRPTQTPLSILQVATKHVVLLTNQKDYVHVKQKSVVVTAGLVKDCVEYHFGRKVRLLITGGL